MTLTKQVADELRELEIETVELGRNEAPPGAMSGPGIDWSLVLVTLAASGGVLTTVINLLQARLSRDERRSVTVEIGGDKLTLTGVSSEQQQQLIDEWLKRQAKGGKK
ncbi:MAG: hypothetical protein HYZ49_07850 [Chloroflexi bacterium]|nr:hypothetical protein [Chloroflexota bacterium]